jgi:hypothetical protein
MIVSFESTDENFTSTEEMNRNECHTFGGATFDKILFHLSV